MNLAPVLVFAYNRPSLLAKMLESLSSNELAHDSIVYVYCDGPKATASPADLENISRVRMLAKSISWSREVHVIEAEKNKGLAESVISGVTEIVNRYGKVIVVEDDVLLSPWFLRFMNEALDKFESDERILSIGSWNYFAGMENLKDNFFIRFPDSIAWATFRRSWNLFNRDTAALLHDLQTKNRMNDFNCGVKGRYFEKMLHSQHEGKIDSWAIRWTAVSVLHGKLNFYPHISLSKHIGFGTSATHETITPDYNSTLRLADEPILLGDVVIEESQTAIRYWKRFVKREFISQKSILIRIINRIKRIFNLL